MDYYSQFTLILARYPLDDVREWTFQVKDAEEFKEIYNKIIELIAKHYEASKAGLKIPNPKIKE